MNLQEELKALKERIDELEEQAKEEYVKGEQAFPQGGDDYCFVDAEGNVVFTTYTEYHDDKRKMEIGNIFRTKEEAEFAAEKLRVEAELRKYSKPFKEDDDNCFIQINSSHNNIVIDNDECYQTQGTIYFKNRFEAHDAIETVGEDRIKKYIFGVEDLIND
ncbi:hypothetical protein [Stenotrophomonas phage vB_SmeS_BUCT704]|nr:hypothetical protein [Stenotrophomonas phage vB_SmeS_BUCT702]UUG68411.1 hypothetical protein [Stenotrophomonas phage vB_SmeS_BUCT704]